MSLSPADVALLRGNRHTVEVTLNATPRTLVASAQLNQATFSYPIAEVTVDGQSAGWSDIKVGQAFSIGTTPEGYDVTWGVVRKAPSGNTFYLDAKSLGDPGYPRNIMKGLENDLYLTVWKHRPPWGMLSAIRNKVFYKAWDLAYTNQGSQPDPIARIGQHRQADVAPGGSATLTFTADPYPWGTATITGHQWALDGGSVVSGSLTAASVTASFTAGWYVIEYTCTDSNSKTHTGFRYLWVNDGTNAFGDRFRYQITSDSEERQGRKLALTVYGVFTDDDLFPGQAFMLTETARFDGQTLADETAVTTCFFGYLAEMEVEHSASTPSIAAQIESPALYAKRLPAAPQQMAEKTSPANWTQVKNMLSNPVGAAWYILQHHAPQLLAAHDFEFDTALLTLRKQTFVFQQDNIGAMLQSLIPLAQFANLGSVSDGTLVFVPSAVHLNAQADRDALDTKFTWDVMDILSPLRHSRLLRLPVAEVTGGAFSYSGGSQATPYRSRAPGNAQAQGVGRSEFSCIVTPAQGQTYLNQICGHQFAIEAAEVTPFSTDLNRNLDIVEPARTNVWHGFAFPTVYDPFRKQWVTQAIPLRVNRKWGPGIVKKLSAEWQPDTFGQPGVTVPIERSAGAQQVQEPVRYDPNPERSFALAWNAAGVGARTFDFNSSQPHWQALSDSLTGKVNDMALDYSSAWFVEGEGALGAWLVTTSGTTLRVYYVPDVRAPVTAPTLQATYTMADATTDGTARIASSKSEAGFCVAAWRGQTGTRIVRTTDGVTWGSAVTVGDTASDAANDNADIGLAVDGVNQLVTARHTDGDYYLYLATATGGSFSRVTTSPASDAPYPLITVDGEGNCYVRPVSASEPPPDDGDFHVTFDTGGYEDYELRATLAVNGSGYTGNCASDTIETVSGTPDPTVQIEINLGPDASYTVYRVAAFVKIVHTGGETNPTTNISFSCWSGLSVTGSFIGSAQTSYTTNTLSEWIEKGLPLNGGSGFSGVRSVLVTFGTTLNTGQNGSHYVGIDDITVDITP